MNAFGINLSPDLSQNVCFSHTITSINSVNILSLSLWASLPPGGNDADMKICRSETTEMGCGPVQPECGKRQISNIPRHNDAVFI